MPRGLRERSAPYAERFAGTLRALCREVCGNAPVRAGSEHSGGQPVGGAADADLAAGPQPDLAGRPAGGVGAVGALPGGVHRGGKGGGGAPAERGAGAAAERCGRAQQGKRPRRRRHPRQGAPPILGL
eukprot:9467603-Pyramimonas_sp.AAC.1